jgi:hypothetical protein
MILAAKKRFEKCPFLKRSVISSHFISWLELPFGCSFRAALSYAEPEAAGHSSQSIWSGWEIDLSLFRSPAAASKAREAMADKFLGAVTMLGIEWTVSAAKSKSRIEQSKLSSRELLTSRRAESKNVIATHARNMRDPIDHAGSEENASRTFETNSSENDHPCHHHIT